MSVHKFDKYYYWLVMIHWCCVLGGKRIAGGDELVNIRGSSLKDERGIN